MKVIFLDFDGVLNSEASFRCESRRKTRNIQDLLSPVLCSNLQFILEHDSSVRLIISSTWRAHHTKVELQNILNNYGVEAARIIGYTPRTLGGDRAHEINLALEEWPNITKFVIIDDDDDVLNVKDPRGHVFQTTPDDGLTLKQAKKIVELFKEADHVRQGGSKQ